MNVGNIYYRGTLKGYSESLLVKEIIMKIEEVDVIIVPIADNRMFYIMTLFAEGKINVNVALHSFSASKRDIVASNKRLLNEDSHRLVSNEGEIPFKKFKN